MSKISLKHSGGNVVSLNSPTSAPTSADVAFKLPNQDGSASQALITDGSGNLSFASTGKILQLLSVTKTDTQSIAQSAGTTDISGLSITITPASSSSKFYITGKVQVSQQYASNGHIQIDVNGTDVGKADAASNRPISHTGIGYPATTGYSQYSTFPVAIDFLVNATDGNAHTIKLQGVEVSSGVTLYINRSQTDPDSTAGARYVSTLTVMEVAG